MGSKGIEHCSKMIDVNVELIDKAYSIAKDGLQISDILPAVRLLGTLKDEIDVIKDFPDILEELKDLDLTETRELLTKLISGIMQIVT